MRSVFITSCLTSILVVSSQVSTLADDLAIRYAAELNHVPLGCRTVSMGNTGVVLPNSDFNTFWNPSLSALSKFYTISVEGAKLYAGLSSIGAASFTAPVQNGLNAGLTYTAFFSDCITQWDSLSLPYEEMKYKYPINGYQSKGIFRNNKHRVNLSVAKLFSIPLPRKSSFSMLLPVDLCAGLNIKALWDTMDPPGKLRVGYNINLDMGVVLRLGVDYDMKEKCNIREVLISVSLHDFLPTKMIWMHSYEEYKEPIDGSQYYGLAYIDKSGFLSGNWTIALSMHRSYNVSLHAGLEGEFFNVVAFRCGISDGIPTLGAGVHYKHYFFDYSFSFDRIDYTYLRLAAGVRF